jgi:hypothetical protein
MLHLLCKAFKHNVLLTTVTLLLIAEECNPRTTLPPTWARRPVSPE